MWWWGCFVPRPFVSQTKQTGLAMTAKSSPLYLKQIEVGPMQNFVYLIGDLKKRECVIVDPAWEVPRVLEEAERDEMKVVAALLTHSHYDHVNGVGDFLNGAKGKVYCNYLSGDLYISYLPVISPWEYIRKIYKLS